MDRSKRIVVVGPESTGKSTLCAELAAHFKTDWVPEYAREYLLKHGTNYSYDDLLIIAKGQLTLEQQKEHILLNNSTEGEKLLFIDTNMYVMQVWCEFVFQKCHSWILERIAERPYDLYLLCNVDLPWVRDELREYSDLESRNSLYHIYRQILINQEVPWVDISGSYEERFQKAVKAVTARPSL